MLSMFRDLLAHKAHADAAMLTAIRDNSAAAADPEIQELLHHVLLANRYWLLAILEKPFVLEEEERPPASFDTLIRNYRSTQEQESAWIANAAAADLDRRLEGPLVPGGACSVAEALMQVCLHSHGHRAQYAKLLRKHGSVPPKTDFILWLKNRPAAEWPR